MLSAQPFQCFAVFNRVWSENIEGSEVDAQLSRCFLDGQWGGFDVSCLHAPSDAGDLLFDGKNAFAEIGSDI